MKKIDKLLLMSFIGPFVVSFGIALFVLIMQFLWLYIDEIAGKGVSILILIELIAYLSVATFPMALPIAVLIASVMVMGNFSERYELSSMKSAGVSLLRIMAPLIAAAVVISYFSYFCANQLIPIANLQFKSRLYDIRKQKPALTLEPGIFNEDFRQFVIRIGSKEKDGETIADVFLENMSSAGRLKFNQILADSGQMYTTADKRFFVMNLHRGTQYQEPSPAGQSAGQKYPFIRMNFKSYRKVWDLQEFEMTRTDETRFQTQRSMLSMQQLEAQIDSLHGEMRLGSQEIARDLLAKVNRKIEPPQPDTSRKYLPTLDAAAFQPASSTRQLSENQLINQRSRKSLQTNISPNISKSPTPQQKLTKPLTEYASLLETFDTTEHRNLLGRAASEFRGVFLVVENRISSYNARRVESVKSGYELHTKYSFALICLIFMFIGAPLGSIIRKGGFGPSILVAIIFFSIFITLTIACKKLAETYILTPFWAAMVPCLVLAPVAAFVTRRAMNDAQIFSFDRWTVFLIWLKRKLKWEDGSV